MNKKILIGVIIVIAVIAIIIGVFCVIKNTNKNDEENYNQKESEEKQQVEEKQLIEESKENESEEKNMYSIGKHHATMVVKKYGTIKLELDADIAPITVANFAKLVNEGFYNGLTFHRIISGFMIQGGDPEGTGMGGSNETIKGEFSSNGVQNNISHVRGVISMARSQMFDSASSQFFIVHKDSTFLDGQYAGFGKVTEGIEVVDEICKDTSVEDTNGTVAKQNQPIIESIKMDD